MRARSLIAVVVLVVSLLAPAGASAHGADAAVALLRGDSSYPIGVRPDLRRALDTMLRQARAKGDGLKVAIVGDAYDVPARQLLLDPNGYAALLAQSLFRNTDDRIVTVHPAGLGGANLEERAAGAVNASSGAGSGDVDTLVVNAMRAVSAVTKSLGEPVPMPSVKLPPPPAAGDGGAPIWLSAGGIVVVVIAGLGLTTVLARRREIAG